MPAEFETPDLGPTTALPQAVAFWLSDGGDGGGDVHSVKNTGELAAVLFPLHIYTFRTALLAGLKTLSNDIRLVLQWRRQRSKGARSFRGQNVLEPGHPDALFYLKMLTIF